MYEPRKKLLDNIKFQLLLLQIDMN